ncbi:MAG: hypothetical protein M0Z49_03950 [Chloroflexi bacterium]|nr:hypothetical protein [Chloroflexota bacterium]
MNRADIIDAIPVGIVAVIISIIVFALSGPPAAECLDSLTLTVACRRTEAGAASRCSGSLVSNS